MKKVYIIGIIILSVSAICLIVSSFLFHTENYGLVNFQLYGSYVIDTTEIRAFLDIVDGTPFTHFVRLYSAEDWDKKEEFKKTKLKFPETNFDFDDYKDKYVVVVIGRELVEIKYEIEKITYEPHKTAKMFNTEVTFAEDYHDQIMYLYIMDNKPPRTVDGRSEFYVMKGSEKVYLGADASSINETGPLYGEIALLCEDRQTFTNLTDDDFMFLASFTHTDESDLREMLKKLTDEGMSIEDAVFLIKRNRWE